MTVIDIIFRVDAICQKYDKYDVEKQRELNAYGDDVFARLFAAVELEIEAALKVSPISLPPASNSWIGLPDINWFFLEIWDRRDWEE